MSMSGRVEDTIQSNRGFVENTQKLDTITSKQHRGLRLDKTLSSPEILPRKVAPNFLKKVPKPAKKRGSTCKSNFLEDNYGLRDSPKASNCYSELYLDTKDEEPSTFSVEQVSAAAVDRGDATSESPRSPGRTDSRSLHAGDRILIAPADRETKDRSPVSGTLSPDGILKELHKAERESKKTARVTREMRERLAEIQKKPQLAVEASELSEMSEALRCELARYESLTRAVRRLLGADAGRAALRLLCAERAVLTLPNSPSDETREVVTEFARDTHVAASCDDSPASRAWEVAGAAGPGGAAQGGTCGVDETPDPDAELARRLGESYDMQEKLAAENADLESKRFILYKELMAKEQRLEMYRAQIGRLQGELKMITKENSLLLARTTKNHPEGDATERNQKICSEQLTLKPGTDDIQLKSDDPAYQKNLKEQLKQYKLTTAALESQIANMEGEMRAIQEEMKGHHACRGGGGSCFDQSKNVPPFPPYSKDCGVCPPCPASCNPNAPPTPAEREVAKLSVQLKQLEENFKFKVTECAMLRGEAVKRKEELEKERCLRREIENKNREMEIKYQGLATHTNMMLGTKEQALEQETNVRTLKQCYREAKEEIEELRLVVKEQEAQVQDYRAKYMQAQQLVEEQRRQMDMLDMDNTRISEQINLEIQRVKLKFQEKLQELSPLPEILKATQLRLKESQQSQAIAEHNAESLARELHSCREKVHLLLHNTVKTPDKNENKNMVDEKQMQLLQQRIQQLTEANSSLKLEQERLKANVIRQEEAVLANEKRLQEKMHECAQLGGELDRARDEAARAVSRAQDRTDTVRKCMQTHVAELERQLAAARAQFAQATKERDELRARMQCQINRLNDSFEQAQMRILGLQDQVQTLRQSGGDAGDDDRDDSGPCTCRSFFA